MTLTYYGSEKVVSNYNVMGVAKAAWRRRCAISRPTSAQMASAVNAISAGPIRTLAASGIAGFKKMYGAFDEVAPLRSNISIEDVGKTAVYLASDLSSAVTGETIFVDGGFNIVGVPIGGAE
jgi:enoyl-[acyl-carrier protein] reductase I